MATTAEVVPPPAKRQKIAYHHKHAIHHQLPSIPGEGALLPQELLDKLVIDSVKNIVEEQAYKQFITNPVIESVALEALRNAAEEFVHHACGQIRQRMNAARRTVPIILDFDFAWDIPPPLDQLQPYKVKTEINRPLLPTPPPEDEFHNGFELPERLLGPELSRQQDLSKFSFNVKTLPPVPSAHTYRDSAVFEDRVTDSKKLRELATDEGKLGEQALRRLAGALKADAVLSVNPDARFIKDQRPRRLRWNKKPTLTEEAMFEETMRGLLLDEPGFELGPVVSCEKQYRMPDEANVRRRLVDVKALPPGPLSKKHDSPTTSRSYNILPPPKSKPRPSADEMEGVIEL